MSGFCGLILHQMGIMRAEYEAMSNVDNHYALSEVKVLSPSEEEKLPRIHYQYFPVRISMKSRSF